MKSVAHLPLGGARGSRTSHLVDRFVRNWTVIYCVANAIKRFRTCNYLADLQRTCLSRSCFSNDRATFPSTKMNVLSPLLKLITFGVTTIDGTLLFRLPEKTPRTLCQQKGNNDGYILGTFAFAKNIVLQGK